MLVLTRKIDQSITLGDPTGTEAAIEKNLIEITVVEIRGDSIRLGIKAPRDVTVHRKEVWEQVQQENQAASGPASTVGLTLDEIRRGKSL